MLMAHWALKSDTLSKNMFGLSPLKDTLKDCVMLRAKANIEQQQSWFISAKKYVMLLA